MSRRPHILVKEKIADSGVALLREYFDVDLGMDWDNAELERRIGDYDGILIRSATQLTADLLAKARRLKVVGRAGIGVDNVDIKAATKRGIVVANAPQSNIVAAAEHTLALMLALARNIPQAHQSLTAGRWERSKLGGVEVYEKVLGVLGFGRIGQLVAHRAKGFGMRVIAYDPFVANERFKELGVEKADTPNDLYQLADFITIHLPRTPETSGWLNAKAFAEMKDGVRIINCARGELVNDADLEAALNAGKVAGVALDVFAQEPITDHPLFRDHPQVVVTPHLGASTTEAQDRAGVQAAEQVVAALAGGVVTNAVNIPTVGAKEMEVIKPFLPLCERLGRLSLGLVESSSVDRIEIEYLGRLADFDTRLLTVAVLNGGLGQIEDGVNYVNAPAIAEERGIRVSETKDNASEDFTELVRVTVAANGERVTVAGTGIGPNNIPHLVQAWGQGFNVELEGHITLFSYRDVPGMIGRVGNVFEAHGINISAAAVGRQTDDSGDGGHAAMIVTTDAPVPDSVLTEILGADGFIKGRSVTV